MSESSGRKSRTSAKDLPRIRLRHIGFVFQSFNLFPTLTAGENVELSLDLKGVGGSRARTRSTELLEAAQERHSFVDADAREEDRARADADIALAKARLAEARALLEKTVIRAPISGSVLRKHFRAGETVPDKVDLPILTLGDQRVLRVRIEVDETDVARVHPGQRAWVTADAFGEKKFYGRVVRVGRLLGKKNVRTDRPSERVDTKVLETLVELDPGAPLPAGLRVDVFIG